MATRTKPEMATTAERWSFIQDSLITRCGIEVYSIKVDGPGFPRQATKANPNAVTQKAYLESYRQAIGMAGPVRGKVDMKLQNLSYIFESLGFHAIPGFKPLPHTAKDYAAAMVSTDAGFWKLAEASIAEYRAGMVATSPRSFVGVA